jgi:hypothetical protein
MNLIDTCVYGGGTAMAVVFSENNKCLNLSILDYQFPVKKGMDNFDANWLTVKIEYTLNEESQTWTDNCLLSDELESLTEDIDAIIEDKETGMITEFMEPYLKFAITRVGDIFAVQIRFVYDTSDGWKEVYISQGMSRDELKKLNVGLRSLSEQFPFRNIEGK